MSYKEWGSTSGKGEIVIIVDLSASSLSLMVPAGNTEEEEDDDDGDLQSFLVNRELIWLEVRPRLPQRMISSHLFPNLLYPYSNVTNYLWLCIVDI